MSHHTILRRTLALCLLALALCVRVAAQSGLHIAPLFDGRYHDRKDATEVWLKGRRLAPYELTLFRSITLQAAAADAPTLERLVRADGKGAVDKEVSLKGGKVYYAFYQLKPRGKVRRYLFYRNDALRPAAGRKPQITLIYMEGSATITRLKQLFGK